MGDLDYLYNEFSGYVDRVYAFLRAKSDLYRKKNLFELALESRSVASRIADLKLAFKLAIALHNTRKHLETILHIYGMLHHALALAIKFIEDEDSGEDSIEDIVDKAIDSATRIVAVKIAYACRDN